MRAGAGEVCGYCAAYSHEEFAKFLFQPFELNLGVMLVEYATDMTNLTGK